MRKTKRNNKQRGGFLFDNDSTTNTYSNPYSSQSNLDGALNWVSNLWTKTKEGASNLYNNAVGSSNTYSYSSSSYGGTRRKQRGGNPVGYPDLSLATNVNGIKMAQPTYWIKGGKRRVSKRVSKKRRSYRK